MRRRMCVLLLSAVLTGLVGSGGTPATAAETMKRYYAYDAVEDANGVIAPCYTGLNGPCDFRARIAAETLKRYPWADASKAVVAAPEYVYSGAWGISPEGNITVLPIDNWGNGDLVQRLANTIFALVEYYRYTGDPAAPAHITYMADFLIDHCLTPESHPWPKFPITVPVVGRTYGDCDPGGWIQLDIAGEAGLALLQAYQLVGKTRWFDMAKHWADLFAAKRSRESGRSPWDRYANPENVANGVPFGKGKAGWSENRQMGGVAGILHFLDATIRLGYTGQNDEITKARDQGRAYVRDVLLPAWHAFPTWGLNYWDNPGTFQQLNITDYNVNYMMNNKDYFPNWKTDVRNILGLFFNHSGTSPVSRTDTYSGAWQVPESAFCCGRSLWYGSMRLALAFGRYGVEADSEWAREIARRMLILSTYDAHETGVSEDNIDGGPLVCGAWFKIAHPLALRHTLENISWLPEILGANRENHIVRSTAIVNSVIYGKGSISYSTFDAPPGTVDVLRLSFVPTQVSAGGKKLAPRQDSNANGFVTRKLSNGDCIVYIRHDGAKNVMVEGDDPAKVIDDSALIYSGDWKSVSSTDAYGGGCGTASSAGAAMSAKFRGNQVRLIGSAGPNGGKAEVYIDGVKQLVGIDCWNPTPRYQQVLYYKNGLADGEHELRITVLGEANPYSTGTDVCVDAVQFSDAAGSTGYGEGKGPTQTQRWIFGYTKREDYVDSGGKAWRPATEWVARTKPPCDSVAKLWWTEPSDHTISGTADPELYRYGAHAPEIIANFTVGPGKYHARLKFAVCRGQNPEENCVTILANGTKVVGRMDVAATAGGIDKAADIVINGLEPKNGIVEIRLIGPEKKTDSGSVAGDAFIQAIEVGLGDGGQGLVPVSAASAAEGG